MKRLPTSAFALALGAVGTLGSGSASAADPACGPGFVACFDYVGGQTPQNIVEAPGGAFHVTFSLAGQVARGGVDGRVRVLAAIPLPPGCRATPLPAGCGTTTPLVHHPVWVSNSAQGTILRIPILPGHRAGDPEPRASGLPTVDDFTFTGHGDELPAAVSESDALVLIRPRPHPDGRNTTVLQVHGLQNPTSPVMRDGAAYVASGAYFTEPVPRPNLPAVPSAVPSAGRR